jgi:hypothetical protein
MYNNEWIKELNESYSNNIRNPQNVSEIVLTEEQLNEHFQTLAIIVESIEKTFNIELTEEEIDKIDEQLQLDEVIGVLARLAWHGGKKLLGKTLQAGGKKLAKTGAYRAARSSAIKTAKDATKKAQDAAMKAWEEGGRKGDIPFVPDVKPTMPTRSALSKFGSKMQRKGGKLSKTPAPYKSAGQAAKQAGKELAYGIGGLLAATAVGDSKDANKRLQGKIDHSTEGVNDYDPSMVQIRKTEGRKPKPAPVVAECTISIVENMYDVVLNDHLKNTIQTNIIEIYNKK